jgi:Xaa-Pro dipeptidase
LLQLVRAVKSAEEIMVLERAAAATDAGLLAAANGLTAETTDRELWGQMVLASVRAGADPPRRALLGAGPFGAHRPPAHPTGRKIHAGDVLVAELSGCCHGYEAPGTQMAVLGVLTRDWSDAWQVHEEAWQRALATLQPGTSVAETDAAALGAATPTYRVRLEIQGTGLGGDLPCFPPGVNERNRPEPAILEEGMSLTLQTIVEWDGTDGPQLLTWSDAILITAARPRRLGTRRHEIIVR